MFIFSTAFKDLQWQGNRTSHTVLAGVWRGIYTKETRASTVQSFAHMSGPRTVHKSKTERRSVLWKILMRFLLLPNACGIPLGCCAAHRDFGHRQSKITSPMLQAESDDLSMSRPPQNLCNSSCLMKSTASTACLDDNSDREALTKHLTKHYLMDLWGGASARRNDF